MENLLYDVILGNVEGAPSKTCFQAFDKRTTSKKRGTTEFVLIHGILFLRYRTAERRDFEQLVVSMKLRAAVMKMAQQGMLAGHQGQKSTTDRVLESSCRRIGIATPLSC
ncbi:hypothetical protein HPB52_014245 [Rhipicephalus sanguineus]|uniref:Uncharacterized protein n=1 Tax=Rhipicephalus sanguineus TaxID=34632 RepID=A0A9D4SRI7_RHISA|nr:hypothetical protein HPB52_014245 [Rhipicephalus sanguineus]